MTTSSIADYILDNIQKKIKGEPHIHYALQGENRNAVLLEAYVKAKILENSVQIFTYIPDDAIVFQKDLLQSIYQSESKIWADLIMNLSRASPQHFVFIEDFDKLITWIDPRYDLSSRLVEARNLYMTVSATSEPKLVNPLNKSNSPYWKNDYFKIIRV
jgi:hypothetical protein